MSEQTIAEIDRISWLLFKTWQRVDPNSAVAKHPVSYMANFADMARAVIADRAHLLSETANDGEREKRPTRDKCTCPCHRPGALRIIHIMPCCDPAPTPTEVSHDPS